MPIHDTNNIRIEYERVMYLYDLYTFLTLSECERRYTKDLYVNVYKVQSILFAAFASHAPKTESILVYWSITLTGLAPHHQTVTYISAVTANQRKNACAPPVDDVAYAGLEKIFYISTFKLG